MKFISLFSLSMGVFASGAIFAKGKGTVERLLPGGLMFPMFNVSALVNPSTLPLDKGTAIQGSYTVPNTSADINAYTASLATAKRGFGFGLGYLGASFNSEMTHGGFIGAGFTYEIVSLGININDTNLDDDYQPDVDFGVNIGFDKGLNGGIVLREINHSAQLNVGLGYIKKKKYNLEVNLMVPDLGDASNSDRYVLSVAVGAYVGFFGASFKTEYFMSSKDYRHHIALLLKFSDRFSAFGEFVTDPSSWTVGLTVAL